MGMMGGMGAWAVAWAAAWAAARPVAWAVAWAAWGGMGLMSIPAVDPQVPPATATLISKKKTN